ncbi:MAG: hypothetical protein A3G87_06335 [Omnitrophica bacterium RIFCSPLOWO2_12_FULL_50_11]|nr:MAG: hypothetical protein A3G87_06335 [Omnitrophica bacterium RIFCSPLOWO2_12_FULL_50_11]
MDPLSTVLLVLIISSILFLIGAGLLSTIDALRLRSYLKANYYDRWQYVTTVPPFGAGGGNSPRFFRYVFSNEDNKDEKIVRLKDSIKRYFYTAIVFAFTIVVSVVFLFGIHFFHVV